MADPITPILIISAIVGVAAAGVSYYNAMETNKRAQRAADERNDALQRQYDAQSAGESKKAQAQQRRLSYERHLKAETVAASMASAGVVTTTGSAAALQTSVDQSYRVAAAEAASQATGNQQVLLNNLGTGFAETNFQLQSTLMNPLLEGFSSGLSAFGTTLSIGSTLNQMGAFTSAAGTAAPSFGGPNASAFSWNNTYYPAGSYMPNLAAP